jgi:two-component system LytT family response regulator
MIKVVLLDDEQHGLDSLSIQLKQLDKSIEIIASFSHPLDALPFIKSQQFDILFLDIEMPGLSGFDVLEKVAEPRFDVIFTTAYNQFAVKAFQYSAISYLLKPIDEDELLRSLNLWEKKVLKYIPKEQYRLFLNHYQKSDTLNNKIALPTAEGLEFINASEIVRCQSDSNYTFFYLSNQEKILICRTLKEVESLLAYHGFVRIHQSHLINPAYLRKFIRQDGGYVMMQDGEEISVSKAHKDKVMALFNQIERR